MDIREIHESVFQSLIKEHRNNPDNFFFTLRKVNNQQRLEKGYWFHGDDYYLSVSFWSGFDWMNKTPNIYLHIGVDEKCMFVISSKDHPRKRAFAVEKIYPLLERLKKEGKIEGVLTRVEHLVFFYFKKLNYIKILNDVINYIRPGIDSLVRQKEADDEGYYQAMEEFNLKDDILGTQEIEDRSEGDQPIGFIDSYEFGKWLSRVEGYRQHQSERQIADGIHINHIRIQKGFGDIREDLDIHIPEGHNWVFLTGENGSGKTTILKAITSFFCNNDPEMPKEIDTRKVDVTMNQNIDVNSIPFAAYGPSRLISTFDKFSSNIDQKKRPWYGVFNYDGVLRGFDDLYELYKGQPDELEDIVDFLSEMFRYSEKQEDSSKDNSSKGELIPQLAQVNFKNFMSNGEIVFQEKDNDNVPYEGYATFDKLASGVRSLVALISDLIIRFLEKKPSETDFSNFDGIVLIDEIDIHYHPTMQKQIIEILSGWFPKIQFIVTTHSPITFLGAPPNSLIYRVSRTAKNGITVDLLDSVPFGKLMPNAILTSPIFGLSDVLPESRKTHREVRTENSWDELKLNDEIQKQLKRLYNELKNEKD